jgi:hypothetical protein
MTLAEIARQAIGRGDADGGDRRRIIWSREAQVQEKGAQAFWSS